MASQITVPAEHGIAGAIVWGSGDDVYSRSDCARVKGYVETTLGPLARKTVTAAEDCAARRCQGAGRCVNVSLDGRPTASCACFDGRVGPHCGGGGPSAHQLCTRQLRQSCGSVGGTEHHWCANCTQTHRPELLRANCSDEMIDNWCVTPSPESDLRGSFVDVFDSHSNDTAMLAPPNMETGEREKVAVFSGPTLVLAEGVVVAFSVAQSAHRSAGALVLRRSTDGGST